MATCHDQFTHPNAKASHPGSEKKKENASCYNHRLILLLKYLLLSSTGMKTYSPVSLRSHVRQHTTALYSLEVRGLSFHLSVNLLPGLFSLLKYIIIFPFPA